MTKAALEAFRASVKAEAKPAVAKKPARKAATKRSVAKKEAR